MPSLFTTASVATLTGASVRQIDHWARTGLLRPSGRDAAGKGTRRGYTFQDVVALKAIQSLREGNCPLSKIRAAIAYLRKHDPDLSSPGALGKLTLLTDGKRVYLLVNDRDVMDAVTRQLHLTWVVPLGRLILDAQRRLEAMSQAWSETIRVRDRAFRIEVSREAGAPSFVAACRELPGAIATAVTSDGAITELKERIALAIEHQAARPARRGGQSKRRAS